MTMPDFGWSLKLSSLVILMYRSQTLGKTPLGYTSGS